MPEKLGQNFLVNKDIVGKIIKAADLKSADLVVGVGPGKGILTEELAKKAGKVMAVEIDKNLADLLRNKLRNYQNVEIIEKDILKISNFKFLISNKIQNPNSKNKETQESKPISYKVIANLPYYITSLIIRKFLESDNPPSEMILMVQKEVAERICEKPGKISILAVSVQYYAQPEILFYVEKGNFDPVPEVDSAVIRIVISHQSSVTRDNDFDKKFFRVVRAGFCAKRKTLANNLANSFHLDKKEVEEKLKQAGLSTNIRAQELGVDGWKAIAELF